MAVEHEPCLTIRCDGCTAVYSDYDSGGAWHFASVEEASEHSAREREDCEDDEAGGVVLGWLVGPDGSATCERCRQKAYCSRHGHRGDTYRFRSGQLACTVCGNYVEKFDVVTIGGGS